VCFTYPVLYRVSSESRACEWELSLGCVSGVADHVQIDPGALSNGFYETPCCPENCTINTYYDDDKHVCLSCPENTYRDGLALSTARLSL